MENVKFNFSNHNILVTGASSGIGRQIAGDLSNCGATVFAMARREHELKELQQVHNNIIPVVCDVTDYTTVNGKIKNLIQEFGKFDGFVGCAGISELIPLRVMDLNRAKNIMEVNFWANVNLLSILSKRNISNNNASFVLLSSIAAHKGAKGEFIYSASKAAMIIFVKTIAKEIATRKQRINTVSPGWIEDTEITNTAKNSFTETILNNLNETYPLGLGEKTDISSMCLFLLSDAAKWITGADFIVDGGYLA